MLLVVRVLFEQKEAACTATISKNTNNTGLLLPLRHRTMRQFSLGEFIRVFRNRLPN